MSAAPDLAEPVLGFRAWQLGCGGRLGAITIGGEWKPGTNVARCIGFSGHRAPRHDCDCGFYALHDPHDPRLGRSGCVIGAIAAWGTLEMHRTGFRAEKACVVALALDPTMTGPAREDAERAAERFGVELVPIAELVEAGMRCARPMPSAVQRIEARRRALARWAPRRAGLDGRSLGCRPLPRGRDVGVWVRRHVVAECDGCAVMVRPTRALAALIDPARPIVTVAPGSAVRQGDPLAVARSHVHGPLVLASPFDGRVVETRPGLPGPQRSSGSWVVRLQARQHPAAVSPLLWGSEAVRHYRRFVGCRDDAELAAEVSLQGCLSWRRVRSFADVSRALDRRRDPAPRPAFEDRDQLDAAIAALEDWAAEPELRRALSSLGLTIRFTVSAPDAAMTAYDAGPGGRGTVHLVLGSDEFHRFWSGRLDLGAALNIAADPAAAIRLESGTRGEAMIAGSLLQRLFGRYRERHRRLEAVHHRASAAAGLDLGSAA